MLVPRAVYGFIGLVSSQQKTYTFVLIIVLRVHMGHADGLLVKLYTLRNYECRYTDANPTVKHVVYDSRSCGLNVLHEIRLPGNLRCLITLISH